MKANTKKSDEVHEYYIKLEELLQETVNEQTDELRLQLQEKNEESNELNLQLEENQVLLANKDKQIKTLEKKVVMKQGYSPDKKLIIYILSSKVHIKGFLKSRIAAARLQDVAIRVRVGQVPSFDARRRRQVDGIGFSCWHP